MIPVELIKHAPRVVHMLLLSQYNVTTTNVSAGFVAF